MQKFILVFLFGALFTITSCNKIEEVDETLETEGTVLVQGSFSSGAHPTSGDIQVVKLASKTVLNFKNFTTDAGPDIRVYMAKDLNAKEFTEISSTVKNGTYSLDIPSSVDPKVNKYVLIWCKQFSVLFGSAELK